MRATEVRAHGLGVALVTLSAVIWSTAGLFTRLVGGTVALGAVVGHIVAESRQQPA
jgi:hypothetical protein